MSEMNKKKKDQFDIYLENISLEEPSYEFIDDILKLNNIKETNKGRKKKIS